MSVGLLYSYIQVKDHSTYYFYKQLPLLVLMHSVNNAIALTIRIIRLGSYWFLPGIIFGGAQRLPYKKYKSGIVAPSSQIISGQ